MLDELSLASKNMKNNKTPGIDGLPCEFYKVFWSDIKVFVKRAINYSYKKGEMSISLRQCIINCLPKGDKPRDL